MSASRNARNANALAALVADAVEAEADADRHGMEEAFLATVRPSRAGSWSWRRSRRFGRLPDRLSPSRPRWSFNARKT